MDSIVPDEKDWTWVLEETCGECGFDVSSWEREEMGTRLRANVEQWLAVLDGDDGQLRLRPRPDKWSPLEYAFHVRDVYELYDFRLGLMLAQDGPHYPNWDQDVTAVEKAYNEADVATVRAELAEWGERLALAFDGVDGEQWDRTGFRGDGAAFTVESFARYLLHDPVHHLVDVQ